MPVSYTHLWSIHDKGDGNPHVHLLLTMRPFNPDHSWGKKEVKDWDFVLSLIHIYEIISYDLSQSANMEQIQRMLAGAFTKFPSVDGLIFTLIKGGSTSTLSLIHI